MCVGGGGAMSDGKSNTRRDSTFSQHSVYVCMYICSHCMYGLAPTNGIKQFSDNG